MLADIPSLFDSAHRSAEHKPAGILRVDFTADDHASGGIRMLRRVNKRAVELMQINASVHPVLLFEEYLYSAKQERQ